MSNKIKNLLKAALNVLAATTFSSLDLYNFIKQSAELQDRIIPTMQNLKKDIDNGKYNQEKARKSFSYICQDAANQISVEKNQNKDIPVSENTDAVQEVARMLEQDFVKQYKQGKLGYL